MENLLSVMVLVVLCGKSQSVCPNPEDVGTIYFSLQDPEALAMLSNSVKLSNFTLESVGNNYLTFVWSAPRLLGYAAQKPVCFYKLIFENPMSVQGLPSATGLSSQQSTLSPAQQRASMTVQSIQFTNCTLATHYGLPAATAVRVELQVCLYVNATTVVCVSAAYATANTSSVTGNSSLGTTARSNRTGDSPQVSKSSPMQETAVLPAEHAAASTPGTTGNPAEDDSGVESVTIAVGTIVSLTSAGIVLLSWFMYRRYATRWRRIPSRFFTVELQNESETLSFTDVVGVYNDTAAGYSASGSVLAERVNEQRRHLVEANDNPYRSLST